MWKLGSLAVLAAAALAGCGGGGDGAPSTPSASQKIEASASVAVTTTAADTPAPARSLTTVAGSPKLENSVDTLDSALVCSSNFGPNAGKAILLLPGATQTVDSNYSWSYIPALDHLGVPWCAVTFPLNNTGELQNASEYVTYAVRKMFGITKTKVSIVGFSQSGALPRWSIKYFPDIRPMIDDMISIAASNQGLLETKLLCAPPTGCVTSFSQIATGSNWIKALNMGGETFKGIDYTQIYTRTDDVAVPAFNEATSVSALHTGDGARINVATQDICPLNTADHFIAGSYDPVVFALVMDAFTHEGVANPGRVRPSVPVAGVCSKLATDGIDLLNLPVNFSTKMMVSFASSVALRPKVTKEPELKCYVTGGC